MRLDKKLIEQYWLKKTDGKYPVTKPGCAVRSLPAATIKKEKLAYFSKVTGGNVLSGFSVVAAVYSYLIKRYFPDYNGIVHSDNSVLPDRLLDRTLFFEFNSGTAETGFKKYIQDVVAEVREALAYSEYGDSLKARTGRPLEAYSHFGISFDRRVKADACKGFFLTIGYDGDLKIKASFRESFTEKSRVVHLLNNFKKLLTGLESYIGHDLSYFNLLSKKESQQVLVDFNNTSAPYERDKTIIGLFEKQVELHPQRTAIFFENGQLSYEELNAQANRLGAYLRKNYGIQADDAIGICLQRSERMLLAIFGILKSGAAYVPIDPAYPQERIDYIKKDSNCKLVVDEAELALFYAQSDQYPSGNIARNNTASSLAYIIYTSGTTGQPKGAMIAHASLVNRLSWMQKTYALTGADVLLQKTTYSFDVSVWELLWWSLYGAGLCLPAPGAEKDPALLIRYIAQHKVSVIHFVPSMLSVFLEYVKESPESKKLLVTLKQVYVSGEALGIHQRNDFYETLPGLALMNLYGPTEASIDVSYYDCSLPSAHSVPIGKPIDNTRLFILDEWRQPVPVGVSGSLYISGIGLAKGYINKPELTNEKFIDNPFEEGTRIYDTGDIARWLPDGIIEYIGRKDNQVKVRGYRIELGEIETALQKTEGVKQCAVLAQKDKSGNGQLTAYVVMEGELDTAMMEASLSRALPDYMIPRSWMQLTAMPLTANGKADRKALSGITQPALIKNYIAPRNETEEKLAGIWEEILDIERPGIEDSFFALGGHSLLATRLVSMIRNRLVAEISIRDVFNHPTIASMSDHIRTNSKQVELPFIEHLEHKEGRLPLSYSQEQLWFIDRLHGSEAYHLPAILRLKGKADRDLLERVLMEIISRHEVLRTVFREEEGIGYQEVMPAHDWKLDYRKTTATEQELKDFTSRPFDLTHDYMMRACLFEVDTDNYVLAVFFHHIASDGWSNGLLVKEFTALYDRFKNGQPSGLTPLRLQYSDYALWQRKNLTGDYLEKQLNYWEEKLSGAATLELPTDYQRPPVQTTAGAQLQFQLDKTLSDRLNTLCREEGVTLFMLLLGVFKVLLRRYSGQEDISVGTPLANRTQHELENMIGFFVNTLVLRNDVSGDPSFTTFLHQVKQTTLEAYDHQQAPFEKLVERLVKERDMSRSPLFQVVFVLQNMPPVGTIQLEGLELSMDAAEAAISKFDLIVTAEEGAEGISYSIGYNTDLFSSATINRMALHYNQLLRAVANDRHKKLSGLPMLTAQETHQILHDFNATETTCPSDVTVVELFEKQAGRTPAKVAIRYKSHELSYRELDERSNQLAHYLLKKGIAPESLVPVCTGRGIETIVAILGVLKAGGAYVPIDPEYPAERILYMLEDTAASLIIAHSNSLDHLPVREDVEVVLMDKDGHLIANEASAKLQTGISAHNLAYVMYTSGSTGQPKGVLVTHGNVVSLVKETSYAALNAKDKLLSTGSPSFDAATFEYWGMLLNGGELVLCDQSSLLDTHALKNLLRKNGVNKMWFTAGLFNELVDQDISIFESLSSIIVGGDRLSPVHIEKLYTKNSSINIINGYGPTENTTFSLTHIISRTETGERIPIGRPLENRNVYVLDEHQNLCGIGMKGELCVSGAGLARGYLNQPALTEEKFISHPFKPGERMYRTGDQGRWLPDGTIEFLGRRDEQVKIRGYRVELGEIENAILHTGMARQCAVLVKESGHAKQLLAYIVPENGFSKEDIENALNRLLPDYMVPRLWMILGSFPLTRNGKIDRKALPDPDKTISHEENILLPRNETEAQLVAIWKELLDLDSISTNAHFFESGGHSLLATRLVSLVRSRMDVELSIADVFDYPVLSSMSERIGAMESGSLLPPVESENNKGKIPLSYSQERLWFIDKLQGSLAYHIPALLNLSGEVDADLLERALRKIVTRHEVLRTVIREEDGTAYQEVIPSNGWSLEHRRVAPSSLDAELKEINAKPFDLSSGYMMRACLLELDTDRFVLAVILHHIASDGWSNEILVREFASVYNSLKNKEPFSLAPLHLQYSDYALWQRRYVTGDYLEKQLGYWEEKLAGVTPLQLPTDRARPAVQSMDGDSLSFRLDKGLSDALNKICSEEGVTLFMLLLAAFKVLLHRYTGQEDICVGTPLANRTQRELEGVIGFFVNTLVIRSDMSGNPGFTQLLQKIKGTTLEAYDHQQAPFEKIVERVVKERDRHHSPLFQVLFVLQNTRDIQAIEMDGLTLSPYAHEGATAKFDLTLTVAEREGIEYTIGYRTGLFNKERIGRMMLHYKELLCAIVSNRNTAIGSLSMLTRAEEQKLLYAFNSTKKYPSETTLVQLFAKQVKRLPNHTALVYEDQTLTYRELDERSNRLARYLRKKGVGAETLVPVCIERGVEMIVALLGILKAGGAYVPIDPDYPADRINFMLRDIGACLILSSMDSCNRFPSEHVDEIILVDAHGYLIGKEPNRALRKSAHAFNLAYVIYTSGSTGRPKGVLVEHRAVVNELLNYSGVFGYDPSDRQLLIANYIFDASVEQIFLPLVNGARLVVTPKETLFDPALLQKTILENGITHIQGTPSLLQLIPVGKYPHLKRVCSGGETCPPSLAKSWSEYVDFYNKYGPTETAINVSYHKYEPSADEGNALPIGKPLHNIAAYIIDRWNRLAPEGVIGELCIGGVQLARGYLNNGQLTNEKFIPDPFHEGARIYRTGDLGKWRPYGTIELLGRMDGQVKIRGHRVELGEIEQVLTGHTTIKQAVVLLREDQQLVAYIVPETGFEKHDAEAYLKNILPHYMVPQLWVELEFLPITHNGKLDRKALPDAGFQPSSSSYAAPRTETEEQLAAIWQELLGLERIGIHDNFFESGGHSLLATRLVSAIRNRLGAEMAIKDVFDHPTIAAMSGHLSINHKKAVLPLIRHRAGREEKIPLSYSQERLWFLDHFQGTEAYHIPAVVRLQGSINPVLLERTLKEVVSRHEVLRTVIRDEEGVGYQEVMPAHDWRLENILVEKENLEEHLREFVAIRFDLSGDYMMRACLYRLDQHEYVLCAVFHHIASDGWSNSILVREFAQLYNSYKKGTASGLAPLDLQYSDYALWQREYISGDFLERQLQYWEEKLDDVAVLDLPADRARLPVPGTAGSGLSFRLEKEWSDRLNTICWEERVTLFMILLGAFKVLLHRYSSQEDIAVGVPLANRTQEELEGMIGFFVNTLVIRSEVRGDLSFRELLKQIRKTTLEAYDHQHAPFEKIVERVVKERDSSHHPLFQVMFTLQNIPGPGIIELDGATVSPYNKEVETAQCELALTLTENEDGIHCHFAYSSDVFDAERMERMSLHYRQLMQSIISDRKTTVNDLTLLTHAEEHRLLYEFNQPAVAYPKNKTIVELFEEQAQQNLERLAIGGEDKITYRELNERSNQLAHHLRKKGVRAETPVPICMESGVDMIVGILGIVKAGGAYVPIDAGYPAARIQYILQDTHASLVVSNSTCTALSGIKLCSIERLDIDSDLVGTESKENLSVDIDLCDMAYVIYTSGSTGRPKGVIVEHRNLLNYCLAFHDHFAMNPADRMIQQASVSFDTMVEEVFVTLTSGASLLLVKEGGRDINTIKDYIENGGATILSTTPMVLEWLNKELEHTSGLRHIISGGDSLHKKQVDKLYRDVCVTNTYGPSEATVCVTHHVLKSLEHIIPVGRPFANAVIYILDKNLGLCPEGVKGEICIGGAGVSRGYLNNPTLTAEKFVDDPFNPGACLYRTGDLGLWRKNGDIEFAGRGDSQVKVQGYRIELGEIEAAVQSQSGIRNCVVLAREDGAGAKRLVGYVVPESLLDKGLLEERLKESLPEYMIPRVWVELDRLPLTASGKTDRKALPEPGKMITSKNYVAPRNSMEEKLVAIWCELLGVEKIGIEDNFFEWGGHSLLATRLVSAIKAVFHIEVEVKAIFSVVTIELLGKYISIQLMEKAGLSRVSTEVEF